MGEESRISRLFDLHIVKRLLWNLENVPTPLLWFIWWGLPWVRLEWIQQSTGQLLVQHKDAETEEILDYSWLSSQTIAWRSHCAQYSRPERVEAA